MFLAAAPAREDDELFFKALLDDPPERLIIAADKGALSLDFVVLDANRREHEIWEGYSTQVGFCSIGFWSVNPFLRT
jgi:hypothetical protein